MTEVIDEEFEINLFFFVLRMPSLIRKLLEILLKSVSTGPHQEISLRELHSMQQLHKTEEFSG